MEKINVINLKGEKIKDLSLNQDIWAIKINEIAVKKALDLQMASLRQGTRKAKTRSEVSGGGRKPYRQKGTGNARAGSNRSPIWRGGGIVFAVTPRNYTFKMNKKERAVALKSALSLKAKDLIVVDSLVLNSLKTKDVKTVMNELKLTGKVLFVSNLDVENLFMATRNLAQCLVIMPSELNVYDLLNADKIVFDESAINYVEEVLK